ncbi:hypothetical protein ACFL1X_11365 [Candidatus Hydrogenedentota bacterium]
MRKAFWISMISLVAALLLGDTALAQRGRGAPGGRGRPAGRPMRRGNEPKVGDKIADFALNDVHGKEVKLSDFKNKIFVLELGACT